jgi:hypothetical protein
MSPQAGEERDTLRIFKTILKAKGRRFKKVEVKVILSHPKAARSPKLVNLDRLPILPIRPTLDRGARCIACENA